MIYLFRYKITLERDFKKAREWCIDEFGKIPIKRQIIIRNVGKNSVIFSDIKVIYDEKKASWLNRVYGRPNSSPRTFYFKDCADAMAFKLRWI